MTDFATKKKLICGREEPWIHQAFSNWIEFSIQSNYSINSFFPPLNIFIFCKFLIFAYFLYFFFVSNKRVMLYKNTWILITLRISFSQMEKMKTISSYFVLIFVSKVTRIICSHFILIFVSRINRVQCQENWLNFICYNFFL